MFPIPITFFDKFNFTEILHYKMNDNAANSIIVNSGPTGANGGNGIFIEDLGSGAGLTSSHSFPGKINNAIYFSGGIPTEDYIDGGTNSILLPTDMTFSCWFKTSSSSPQIIAGWNTYYFIVIDYIDATHFSVSFYRRQYTGNYQVYTLPVAIAGVWVHLVIQLEDTTTSNTSISNMKVFVNGVYYGPAYKTAGGTSGNTNGFGRFSVGDSQSSAGVPVNIYPFKGYLDDIRIYSGLIKQSHISQLYNGGSGTEATIT